MKVPRYHIFSGLRDKNAMWLEYVDGLGNAYERMKELARQNPGPYFVFSAETHEVLASIDTSEGDFKARRESA
jgi:hypothetical protein